MATNDPAVVPAVKRGETACPAASVAAVACVVPSLKVAPAPAAVAEPLAPEPSENVTPAPCTGLPEASVTRTSSGRR